MKTYAFLNNHLFINGVEIKGWADGDDVIQFKRRSPLASDKVGAGGQMMVSLKSNKSVEMTIRLQQVSPSNAYLNKLCLAQDRPETFTPVQALWQDSSRQDIGSTTAGYIENYPEIKRGEEGSDQEWKFIFERGDLLLGNPTFAGLPTAVAEGLGG